MGNTEYKQVDMADGGEVEQAARILVWVTSEKAKLAAKLKSLEEMEANARSVVEEALGGADGPAAEAIYQGRAIVRWTKFTTHRFDQANFKKEHTDLFKQYYVEKTERRFNLVPPTEKEA